MTWSESDPSGAGFTGSLVEISGARVRDGGAAGVGVPTAELIEQALDRGDRVEAGAAFDYLVERELHRILTVYYRWIPAVVDWLRPRTPEGDLTAVVTEAVAEGIAQGAPEPAAIAALIAGPPAGPDPDAAADIARNLVQQALAVPDIDGRLATLERDCRAHLSADTVMALTSAYQLHHDDLVRVTWALMAVAQRLHGEDAMADLLRTSVTGPMVRGRTTHAELARMTGREIMLLTVETMRSHFSGPAARGAVDVTEENDRYVVAFDPCGSGGRVRRTVDHGLLASDDAYVRGAHPWTWGEKPVCLYCAHCSFVNEILPIENVGFPKRITLYPQSPGDRCRWVIYKNPTDTPAAYYHRVGQEKP